MTENIDINIGASWSGSNATKAAAAEIERLKAALAGSGGGTSKAAAEAAKLAAAESKLAVEAAKASVAQQRLAAAAAQAAAADSRASAAAAQAAVANDRAAVSAIKRAQAESRAASAMSQSVTHTRSWSQAMRDTAGRADELIGTIQGLGGAFAAIGAAKAVYDFAQAGAAAGAARASFDSLAASAGTTGKALLSSLNEAASGTVANVDLIKSSNTALLLLGSDVATKLPQLLAVAKASATTLGTDVGMVFDSLVTGISRGSTELIDNAGITVKAADAYESYGASIGKSADSLTAAEKQQALLNAVLTSGQTIIEQTSGAGETAGVSFQKLNAAASNLAGTLAGGLAAALAPAAAGFASLAGGANQGLEVIFSFGERLAQAGREMISSSGSYDEYMAKVRALNEALPPLVQDLDPVSEAAFNAAKGLEAAGVASETAAAAGANLGLTTQLFQDALGTAIKLGPEAAQAVQELEPALMAQAAASQEGKAAVDELLQSYVDMGGEGVNLQAGLEDLAAANAEAALEAQRQAEIAEYQAAAAAEASTVTLALADSLAAQAQAADTSTIAGQAQADALRLASEAAQESANSNGTLDAQARAAADALFGSGAAGAAAAAQLAASDSQIDRLTAAYYRLLAAMQATGVSAAATRGTQRRGGLIDDNDAFSGGGPTKPGPAPNLKPLGPVKPTVPPPPPKPPRAPGAGGGGGGAGGSSEPKKTKAERDAEKRTKEAEKTEGKLADIAAKGGERIAEINASTAEKLVAIDQKAAERRAQIAADLNRSLQSDAAQTLAGNEANDLASVGETDKKALAQIAAREKAEEEAAARLVEAQAKAREQIAAGNADAAKAEYDAAKQAIADRQKLDEEYYKKQAELGGNKAAQAELDKQYQEAVKAAEEAAKVEQEIAAAEVEEARAAVAEEKAAVIAAAEEQKQEVVKKATEQAEGVKGASEAQQKAVVDSLAAQAQAVTDWASAYEAAAGRVATAASAAASATSSIPAPGGSDGGGTAPSGNAAAGGGTFVSSGPTQLTVGDNPGGVELVTVTPLSGRGSTRVGPGMARMAGGGAMLAGSVTPVGGGGLRLAGGADALSEGARLLDEAVAMAGESAGAAEQLEAFADGLRSLLDVMETLQGLSVASETPLSPINADALKQAVTQMRQAVDTVGGKLVPLSEETADGMASYADVAGSIVGLVEQLPALRQAVSNGLSGGALDLVALGQLAIETRRAGDILIAQVVPISQAAADAAQAYYDTSNGAIDLLVQAADLRSRLNRAPTGALDPAVLRLIADDSRRALDALRSSIVPTSEGLGAAVETYVGLAGQAVDILGSVLDLRQRSVALRDSTPIDRTLLDSLGQDIRLSLEAVYGQMLPLSDGLVAALETYTGSAQRAVGVLRDVAELREQLSAKDLAGPISTTLLTSLGRTLYDVTQAVYGQLIPLSDELVVHLERYAGAASTSVGLIRDVSELTGGMFDSYTSPTDAQINRVAEDARRITAAIARAAGTLSQEGAEEAQRMGEAATAAVSAARESLLVMQALNDETFALNPVKLEQFEDSSMRMYDALGRLGARARALDSEGIAAVSSVAEAVRSQAEALTAAGAVPFDNIGALSSAGASTANVTMLNVAPGAIVVHAAPGMDANAVAAAALTRLNQMVAGRR